MKRKDIKYYVVIVLILTITVIYEAVKPKPIDWSFTLESEDKIPYGTYILYNTLADIFPGKTITINQKTTYEYRLTNQDVFKNYIYICESFDADKLDTESILQAAQNGNSMFIASHYFSPAFQDTLKFSVGFSYFDTINQINFYNKQLENGQDYRMGKSTQNSYFNKIDTAEFEILAHSKQNTACFIRRSFGKGMIYISTIPESFTNYCMSAEKNYALAYGTLSYLPNNDIVWDEYYKPFRKSDKQILDILFSNKSFNAGYMLLIVTVLLFVIFTAKRRQRIIPVLRPFENKSLQFIKTIGRLYYSSKNHKDIALKKYNYFQHYVLTNYGIHLSEIAYENYGSIAEKTGVDIDTVKKVLLNYIKINKIDKISTNELTIFNAYLEDFYETCK
jgi:hypothetical protein